MQKQDVNHIALIFMGIVVLVVITLNIATPPIHSQANTLRPEGQTTTLRFDGGFETGDHTQWDEVNWNHNRPLTEQLQIVTSPVRQGQYAAKTVVHDGDEFLNTGGERVDFEIPPPYEQEGDDLWYAFSSLFPNDWQPPNDWLLLVDWHSTYPDACQLLQLEIDNANAISAHILTGDVTGYDCFQGSGTALNDSTVIVEHITKETWHDFIIHVKWTTSNNGLIEIWHKLETDAGFAKVAEWSGIQTLQYEGDPTDPAPPYLILAHYRDASNTHTSTIYHDGFRVAASAADLIEDGLYDLSSVPTAVEMSNQWVNQSRIRPIIIIVIIGLGLLVLFRPKKN